MAQLTEELKSELNNGRRGSNFELGGQVNRGIYRWGTGIKKACGSTG